MCCIHFLFHPTKRFGNILHIADGLDGFCLFDKNQPSNQQDDHLDRWEAGMKLLAAQPHVWAKISGMGFVERTWTTASIRPIVLKAIEIFGTDRVMFASDVPTDKLFSDYATIINAFDEITKDFSDDERRDMFGRNANRAYRLNLDL